MAIWDALQSGDSAEPQAAAPSEVVPEDLASDPILGPLLSDPALMQSLMGTPQGATTEASLTDQLIGSAMEVTGRPGLTGQPFSGNLPAWAADLSPKTLKHPDYDPYFGIVSQEGDERVYMGGEKTYSPGSIDPGAPLTQGMSRVEADGQVANPDGSFNDFYESGPKKPKAKDEEPVTGSGDLEFRSGGQHTRTETETKGRKARKGDETLTSMQAMNLPYTWDEEEVAEYMKRMRQAGIPVTSFDMGSNSLVSVWGALVDRAAMTYAMSEGKRKVTPWDVLDMYKSEAKAAGSYQNYQNGSQTTVQRSVTDVGEGEAWAMLQQNLSRMLGRDPSDQELRDFTFRMNQLAASNPAVSKTITKFKNGEAVSSDTTTESGFSSADMAQEAYDAAQDDPDYADYQAASVYFNAAQSALGAIGQT